MTVLIDSLIPIFLLIALGAGLKRARIVAEESWSGMERITYFVFFPALLIQTLYKADFSQFAAARSAGGFLLGITFMLIAMLLARPALQPLLRLSPASYSSLYQAVTRWNGFVILAIAERLAGAHGLAIVAIGIGVMVVPINVFNVAVVATLGQRDRATGDIARQIALNPLILGVLAGLALNFSGVTLATPAAATLELLARISLPLGVLLVGAGLAMRLPGRAVAAVAVGTAIKLLIMPAVLAGSAYLFGVRGQDLALVALCGAGPTAINGFLLARELGGDAPLFATMATAQTAAAALTLPVVMAVAGMAG